MNKMLESFDAKTITSAGGIVVAIISIYFLWDVSSKRIDNIVNAQTTASASEQSYKDKLADALLQNARAIEGNTKVMEQVLKTR